MEQMSPDVVAMLVQHHRRFRDFLERRVGSRATAEELLQGAFVKGLEHGADLRDGESAVHDGPLHEAVCPCVHGLIPTLEPEYADILNAVEIDGKPVSAVADTLGITSGNASVRLHRVRQALKQRLDASCGACTEHGCLDCTCTGMADTATTSRAR